MSVPTMQLVDEQERLTKFLSWLLDARWFPTADDPDVKQLKEDTRTALRMLGGILKRMEKFTRRFPNYKLEQGLAEAKQHAEALRRINRSVIRRSPVMQTTSNDKAQTAISERLLCASLVIPRLWPGEGIYKRMKKFLDNPEKLPRDTASTGYKLRQDNKGAYRSEPVRYCRSEKALQSLVQRMRRRINTPKSAYKSDLDCLDMVYSQFCWVSLGQAGYSDSEASMLSSLVQEVSGKTESGLG